MVRRLLPFVASVVLASACAPVGGENCRPIGLCPNRGEGVTYEACCTGNNCVYRFSDGTEFGPFNTFDLGSATKAATESTNYCITAPSVDAGSDAPDAGTDEGFDAGSDPTPDAGTDETPDAGTDGTPYACADDGTPGWAVENPLPIDQNFTSVVALGSSEIYGASADSPRSARRWDGASFHAIDMDVRAVWAVPGEVFLATPTGVAHGGGGSTIVHETVGAAFNAVHGSAANEVWAVGDLGNVRRWNGAAWSVVDVGTTESLRSVWVGGPADVWIGIGGFGKAEYALQFNGTAWRTWTKAELGVNEFTVGPQAIWGVDGSSVYFCAPESRVRQFDGTTLVERFATELSGGCSGVSGRSAGDVFFVGRATAGSFHRFDGTNLTEIGGGVAKLSSVHASAAGVAVGGAGGSFGFFDGTTLTMHSSGFTDEVTRVWVAESGEAYAQGPFGIYAGDCGSWRAIEGLTGTHAEIHGLSATQVWLGAIGGVRRVNGTKFDVGPIEPYGIGTAADKTRGLYVANETAVFAAGTTTTAGPEGGTTQWVRRWDGQVWTDLTPTVQFYGVDRIIGFGPDEIFLAGPSQVHRWHDGVWTTESIGVSGFVQDLVDLGNGELLALHGSATENSRIRGVDGTWRSAGYPAGLPVFQRAWARSPDAVFATRYFDSQNRKYLWQWDGTTWTQPAQVNYLDWVHGNAHGDVVAVGNVGRIWRHAER